jgi:hypothetical protein
MACMFFISGLFVRDSVARRGPANFLANRAWRLGVLFLISIFVVTAKRVWIASSLSLLAMTMSRHHGFRINFCTRQFSSSAA